VGVCKEAVLACTNFISEDEVIKDDFVVMGSVLGSKFRFDVLSVFE
jgi:hypothetical protein